MKKNLLLGCLLTALALPVAADIYTFPADGYGGALANGGVIPDYPGSPWTDTRTLTGIAGLIQDVNVKLEIPHLSGSSGWNGDLYAYLRFVPTASSSIYFAQLLNQVGKGSGLEPQFSYGFAGTTAGFPNIWLDDEGAGGNIHNVAAPVAGHPLGAAFGTAYQPDGGSLSVFDGLTANGAWTLFLVDKTTGDQSKVDTWGLEIMTAAVPEPGVWPVAVLIGLVAAFKASQRLRRTKTA